ncbi:MAG: hypothetical protein ACHQC8_07080 [Solirubrobacterales bacterium]
MRHTNLSGPVRYPRARTPLDLGESLLADLGHLFDVEARGWCDQCNAFHARDELEEMNRGAIADELLYFANVLRSRRLGDETRNARQR